MATGKTVLSFDVEVETEQRNGYFAARTKPFAVTVYAKTEHKAEERALGAVMLLLEQYMKTPGGLSTYFNQKNVKHVVSHEVDPQRPYPLLRTCRKEMRLEVPAGVC